MEVVTPQQYVVGLDILDTIAYARMERYIYTQADPIEWYTALSH